MKALVFQAPGQVALQEVPKPDLKQPYGAILHPIAVAPCSSDVHTVYGGGAPKQKDHILGHECVADVVAVAEQVRDFRPGDRVIVPAITPDWRAVAIQEGNDRHAEDHFSGHRLGRTWPGVFAEYFSVPDADTTLAHMPSSLSVKQALMCADVMTTGFTGAEYANIHIGDTVCVVGIGPVGLMAIAGAARCGAAQIIGIGSRAKCKELAGVYGATDIIDYHHCNVVEEVLRMTEGIGADSVIIAGGSDEVFTQAVDMVRYGIGTISNINYYGGTGSIGYPKFSGGRGMAGKTIHMELAKGGRARMERMVKMIQYGRVDPEPLITHVLHGIDHIPEALEMMRSKNQDIVKVMVTMD